MCRPREVRLCCGHLFACASCLSKLNACAICTKPISAGYDVQMPASDDESSPVATGYISSGSETCASMEDMKCCVPHCGCEATHWFECQ